jgi:predicted transcriptional regulator YdeE
MENIKIDGFRLVGIQLDGKTTNENGQSNKDCGALWQRFESEELFGKIPGKKDNAIYAVYFDYEGDHTQPFSYFIGCKVGSDSELPENLQSLEVPTSTYVKKVTSGQMPNCIADGWRAIWESDIDRSYGYDFEMYDERSHNWNNATVDIFVSSR